MRRLAFVGLAIGSIGVVAACTPVKPPPAEPEVIEVPFEFTGAPVEWEVPAGVDEIEVTAFGAGGGHGFASASNGVDTDAATGGTSGLGGSVIATVAVAPGEVLQVRVGGRGGDGGSGSAGVAGFNGGGEGGHEIDSCVGVDLAISGGGGGGSSDLRQEPFGDSERVVVAGGGGGGGSPYALAIVSSPTLVEVTDGGSGGGGGGIDGMSGIGAVPGGGATQTQPGVAGSLSASDGVGPEGGSTSPTGLCLDNDFASGKVGGAGGGGWFGGGGGGTTSSDSPVQRNAPGGSGGGGGSGFPADAEFQTGVRAGNGRVVISYTEP
jgi:hypothetical protein